MKCFKTIQSDYKNNAALFCFPYAGGGASVFSSWKGRLPSKLNIYSFQAPGKEERISELPCTELSTLVTEAADAIIEHGIERIMLFGHSLGALVVYELIKKIELVGQNVSLAIVSGRNPPQKLSKMKPISHLPDKEFISEVKELDGTPNGVFEHPELLEIFLPILKSDFKIAENYRNIHSKRIQSNLFVLSGKRDPWIDPKDLELWKQVTSGTCEIKLFNGDHFFLRDQDPRFFEYLSGITDPIIHATSSFPPNGY